MRHPPLKWDHPRVCGEKVRITVNDLMSIGSPPRVRGKVRLFLGGNLLPGITPACAGKSLYSPDLFFRFKDHPRVCGEKLRPTGRERIP